MESAFVDVFFAKQITGRKLPPTSKAQKARTTRLEDACLPACLPACLLLETETSFCCGTPAAFSSIMHLGLHGCRMGYAALVHDWLAGFHDQAVSVVGRLTGLTGRYPRAEKRETHHAQRRLQRYPEQGISSLSLSWQKENWIMALRIPSTQSRHFPVLEDMAAWVPEMATHQASSWTPLNAMSPYLPRP